MLGSLLAVAAGTITSATALAQAPGGGQPVIINAVEVHGCRTISPEEVKNRLKTRPGQEYNPAVLEDDLRTLAATRWFSGFHPVQLKTEPNGGVTVHIIVEEHPNVVREVIYKNAHHFKPDELDKLTMIRRGAPLNPSENIRACYTIQEEYRKKGRLLASVHLEEGNKIGDERVVFNVTEGPVFKIRKIRFTGNDTLASGARLKTQIDSRQPLTPLALIGAKYIPQMVDHDAIKLEEYYKANGYLDARVTREVIFNDDLCTVDVNFHIHEGLRYRIGDVVVDGPRALDRDFVRGFVRLRQGDVYSEPAVEADIRNIGDLYGYRGYSVATDKKLFFSEKDPGVVRVQYEVLERGPSKVGQITPDGNTVTKDRVIRHFLQFYPGQVLSLPAIRQAEKDLARSGLFELSPEKGGPPRILIEEPDDPNSPYKDVRVIVQEQPTGSLMFGLGVNSNAGLVGSIVLNEKNFDILRPPTSLDDVFAGRAFRGGGQEFRIEAVPGTQLQRYTISFREPYLFDRPISLSTSAYYYQRIYNEYTENRVGTRVTLGYQLNRFWSITGGVRLEGVGAQDVPIFAPPDLQEARGEHLLVGPRVSLNLDTRDSYLKPTEGSTFSASFEQMFGSYSFPIVTLEGSQYFYTYQRPDGSGRHVLALRSQVAFAGHDAPVFERFYAGGFQSLRGFAFRGVGPETPGFPGFKVGGDFMFLNSLEYQIPIKANDQLYVVAFLDSGTVESNVSLHNYRVSAGVGLRVTVPMLGPVPIALDFGFPIVRGPNDNTQLFSFYVGLFRN